MIRAMTMIFDLVSDEFDVPVAAMLASGRGTLNVCHARQCALYIARKKTNLSLEELREQTYRRNHTSTLDAVKGHTRRMNRNPELRSRTELLLVKFEIASEAENKRFVGESWVSKIARGETVSEVK